MIDFSERFNRTAGKPIQYKGKTVVMWDRFPVPRTQVRLRYRIISTSSEWKQGLSFQTKGVIVSSDGNRITKGWADVWEHRAPWEDHFTCSSRNGLLDVKNIWDTGKGCVEFWHAGAAMWIEDIPNGRRYHCNDGHFDDDFEDIIFELTIVPEE